MFDQSHLLSNLQIQIFLIDIFIFTQTHKCKIQLDLIFVFQEDNLRAVVCLHNKREQRKVSSSSKRETDQRTYVFLKDSCFCVFFFKLKH